MNSYLDHNTSPNGIPRAVSDVTPSVSQISLDKRLEPGSQDHLNQSGTHIRPVSPSRQSSPEKGMLHQTIRQLPQKKPSEYFDMSPGSLIKSTDLEDCELEGISPQSSAHSPELQWAPARSVQNSQSGSRHQFHQFLEAENEEAPNISLTREIKRDPQSVQVMHVSSSDDEVHHPNPSRNEKFAAHSDSESYKPALRTIYQQSGLLSTDSFASESDAANSSVNTALREDEDEDEDEEHGRTLLDSLPTPRVGSPKMGFSSEPYKTTTLRHNSNTNLPPPSSSASSGTGAQHSARNSSVSSLFQFSHSPQHSQSSSSEQSGDSPRLLPMRPRSQIGNRAANRQSFYDFSGSTNNFNLNLSDAVSTYTSTGPDGASNVLIPRMKTIELYRKNARKANDPELEFQLAQYMMQTALIAASERARDATAPEKSSKSGNTEKKPVDKEKEDKSLDKIIDKLFKDAVSSLKRLSDRGFADAQYLLGDVYSSDALAKPDMERSFKYFLMAAKHGHAEAAYRAALCLQEGWGTSRDAPRAIQFFSRAAVRNQPGALYQLGMAYFYGGMGISDTSTNRLAGVKWLTRAVNVSDQTYNRAPYELAKIYEVGFKDLVIPDSGYAIKLYTHSADLGFIPAAARLGHTYEFGELGCPQDPNLSIHYYTIAALGNDPSAQLAMCAWYMVGAGSAFPVNHDEAYEWALRAALNGLPKAQYTLGFFYENGTGTKRNVIEAGKWYRRAADGGHEKATAKLAQLGISDKDKQRGKCLVM